MIDPIMRRVPLAAYQPLRRLVFAVGRGNPLRVAATMVLRRAARAHHGHLAARLSEIRPIDRPDLSFEPVDSMVIDAVYWLGVRGYEGIAARVWTELCAEADAVLEIGGNVGLFAVIGATATRGTYTVVEPVPQVAATLRKNLARNGLARVEVLQAAVVAGEAMRDVVMNLPAEGRAMPVGAHLLDAVEVAPRASDGRITVRGWPISGLAAGRDLIKIDAEGIEATLIGNIRAMLLRDRPTLMVEVLPEATRLAALLSELAAEAGYRIHVLPAYGSDRVVTVEAADFTAATPATHHSKDVVLSVRDLR